MIRRVICASSVIALCATATISISAGQAPSAPAGTPTFTKDVLPIFQRSCQDCHRPGTPAPMSLLTYEDARPWARAIKARTGDRQMPPWHIDRSIGEYLNDPSLEDEEIALIARWVDGGAPRGNPADAPAPRKFSALNDWAAGEEPDLIVSMQKGFTIPAQGPDMTPSETVDSGLTEDRYVKWVQVIPTAYCCVHHSHVYAIAPEKSASGGQHQGMDEDDEDSQTHLIEYAMGNDADIFADGTGKLMKAGSKIRFSAHYHPYGKEIHDRQKIGIKFYPKGVVPKYSITSHRIRTGLGDDWVYNREKVENLVLQSGHALTVDGAEMPTGNLLQEEIVNSLSTLSIPPHSVARHERFFRLEKAALVISFQPHMHFRGKRMLLEAVHADGRREVLTDATHYEQTWQMTYTYKEPHLFPAGTLLHSVSWHDNTANNKHNPDPSAWVGWGSRTMDEMGNAWTDIAFLTDSQYQEERAAREARKKNTARKATNQQQ